MRISETVIAAELEAARALLEGSTLEMWTAPMPDKAGTAPRGSLLLSFALKDFSAPMNRAIVAENLAAYAKAGTPGYYRIISGSTLLADGPASELGLAQLIPEGARVLITEFRYSSE